MSDLQARPWPGPVEQDLIPYAAMLDWPAQGILVLAPHPDDEVFGCGGLLALAHQRGLRTTVVIVSDGGLGGDPATREIESRAAAQALGAGIHSTLEFWRLPDRGLVPDAALAQRIKSAAKACNAGWVIAPSPFEVHPDHRAVCRAAIEALAELQAEGSAARLVFCEIGQALTPNALVDITKVVSIKAWAQNCFASQMQGQAYGEQVLGLNRYRAYTLGPAVSHAEGYWFVSPEQLAAGVDGVVDALCAPIRRRLG